jgi:lambda repressor-like predicted transcriptional regulator
MKTPKGIWAKRRITKAKLSPIIEGMWSRGISGVRISAKLAVSEHYVRDVLAARWPDKQERDAVFARAVSRAPTVDWPEPMVETLKSLVRVNLYNQEEIAAILEQDYGVEVSAGQVHYQLSRLRTMGSAGLKLHNPWGT